jgi:hypothetical protein
MKILFVILFIAASMLASFGYWGSYTKTGRLQYDEMAGMIPEFALMLSFLLFGIAAVLAIVLLFKYRSKSSG